MLGSEYESVSHERPIYVSGVARSGTTQILETLNQHPETASHAYRDFPLVYAPLLWARFFDAAAKGSTEAAERAHKDRIRITPESPEAIEEMLWMAFFPDAHDWARTSIMGRAFTHSGFEAFYRDHILKMCHLRGGSRYLCKGNYNVARLGYLGDLFPDARFLLLVRDPVSHVGSLVKQHRLFLKGAEKDPRTTQYMQRLGHFEFGDDYRPLNMDDPDAARTSFELMKEGQHAAAYAVYWKSVYGFLAEQLRRDIDLRERTLVIRYEDLCRDEGNLMARIFRHCDLAADDDRIQRGASAYTAPTYYEPVLTAEESARVTELTAESAAAIAALASG